MDNLSISQDALQKAAEKVRQVQEALETAKNDLKQLLANYDADMAAIRALVEEPAPEPAAEPAAEPAKRRERPKGSTSTASVKPDGRAERSIESRFGTSLTRMMNSKAIPSVTPDRAEAERMLNDAAARVADKNGVEVPDSVWKRIDEHLNTAYGPKQEASTKAKTAKG